MHPNKVRNFIFPPFSFLSNFSFTKQSLNDRTNNQIKISGRKILSSNLISSRAFQISKSTCYIQWMLPPPIRYCLLSKLLVKVWDWKKSWKAIRLGGIHFYYYYCWSQQNLTIEYLQACIICLTSTNPWCCEKALATKLRKKFRSK